MSRIESAEITTIESGTRRLGYANEFRQMLREQPNVVRTTMGLIEKAETEYDPGEMQLGVGVIRWNREATAWQVISYNGRLHPTPQPLDQLVLGRGIILKAGETHIDPRTGLEVTVLGKSKREFIPWGTSFVERTDQSTYAKVSLGGDAFFIKKSLSTNNPGFGEFTNTINAKAALVDMGDLKVIEAQLGYTDDHQSWFISNWEELESSGFFPADSFRSGSPNDYGEYLSLGLRPRFQQSALIEQRIEQIREKTKEAGIGVGDLHMNLFYNPFTKKYIYLDVTALEGARLNQP